MCISMSGNADGTDSCLTPGLTVVVLGCGMPGDVMLLPTAAELSCQGMTSWQTRHAKSHLPIHQGAAAGAYFILVVRSLQSAPRRTHCHTRSYTRSLLSARCAFPEPSWGSDIDAHSDLRLLPKLVFEASKSQSQPILKSLSSELVLRVRCTVLHCRIAMLSATLNAAFNHFQERWLRGNLLHREV